MRAEYERPRLLDGAHDLSTFTCRSVAQTDWLRRYARQAHSSGTARVFVITPVATGAIAAYYGWTMGSVGVDQIPETLRRGAGRYPQPVALLVHLGVALEHEGKGIGAGLLLDVIARTAALGSEIGCRGLLIHAETDDAERFYRHVLPELVTSPTSDLHLYLPMKTIRKALSMSAHLSG